MFPVKIQFRKRAMLPIVEVFANAQREFGIEHWITYPLSIIDLGELMGGRLLPEEPKDKFYTNTVCFVMIFENQEKLNDFIKALQIW